MSRVKILVNTLPEKPSDCPFYKYKVLKYLDNNNSICEVMCTLGINKSSECDCFKPMNADLPDTRYYCNCPYLEARPDKWPENY